MRIATMWKPVAMLDMGLHRLTENRAINSTERMVARSAVVFVRGVPRAVEEFDLPAFLKKQAQ